MKKSDVQKLLRIGGMMSNICFNLSQLDGQPLSKRDCETMKSLQRQWDEETSKLRRGAMRPRSTIG